MRNENAVLTEAALVVHFSQGVTNGVSTRPLFERETKREGVEKGIEGHGGMTGSLKVLMERVGKVLMGTNVWLENTNTTGATTYVKEEVVPKNGERGEHSMCPEWPCRDVVQNLCSPMCSMGPPLALLTSVSCPPLRSAWRESVCSKKEGGRLFVCSKPKMTQARRVATKEAAGYFLR